MKLDFVKVKRYKTEDISGFILTESKKLLAIQYVPDFMVDGILILDKRYIYNLYRNNSTTFQKQMMQDFGITKPIKPVTFDIKNWRSFFNSIASQHPYCMIEDEYTGIDMTYMGKIEKVKKQLVVMHEFSGVGKWDDTKTKIYYDWISMCHLNSHYVSLYEQYHKLKAKI